MVSGCADVSDDIYQHGESILTATKDFHKSFVAVAYSLCIFCLQRTQTASGRSKAPRTVCVFRRHRGPLEVWGLVEVLAAWT